MCRRLFRVVSARDIAPGLAGGALIRARAFGCLLPFLPPPDDDPTGAVCYGESGDQILNSLSVQFTIFGDEGYYARSNYYAQDYSPRSNYKKRSN